MKINITRQITLKQHELTTQINFFNYAIDTFWQFCFNALSRLCDLFSKKGKPLDAYVGQLTFIFLSYFYDQQTSRLLYLITEIITTD